MEVGVQQKVTVDIRMACATLLIAVVCNDVPSSVASTEVPSVRAATEGSTVPYVNPPLDESLRLSGKALIDALRKGGYVLYIRHTETGNVTPECIASNLSSRGERDARFIGESLRKLRIPVGKVLSSPVCRVRDTARLMGVGEAEVTIDLSNTPPTPEFDLDAVRNRRINTPPQAGSNALLVSHMQGGKQVSNWIYLDFGEIIVYRPTAQGRATAMARIRADDWYDLMALEKK